MPEVLTASDVERKILLQDLDKLTEWTNKWQMSFNTKKCKVSYACGKDKSKVRLRYGRSDLGYS